MSTVLYIKTNPRDITKTEVTVESVTVTELSVTALLQAVQAKLGIPIDAQCLVFGGRVLRPGKNLGHYKVTEKSTLYLLPKLSPPEPGETALVPSVLPSNIITQAQNMLIQLLRDPQFMRSILQRTPALATDPVFRQLLENPNSALSDPDIVNRYLEEHPDVVSVLVGMRGTPPHEEGENMEAEPPPYANAQEQMFEHSQALLAHQNSLHEPGAAVGGSNSGHHQQAAAEPHPGVTQNDLVTALAGVMGARGGASQGGPASTTSVEPVQATTALGDVQRSQQVGTLAVQAGTILTPQAPRTPQPPQAGTILTPQAPRTPQPPQAGTILTPQAPRTLQPPQAGTILIPQAPRTPQPPQIPQTITTRYLQRALATAINTTPSSSPQIDTLQRALLNTTSVQSPQNVGIPSSQQQQDRRPTVVPPSERYRIQLNRLHSMGLTDDAASLHVLEAMNGDIDATVEILLGGLGH